MPSPPALPLTSDEKPLQIFKANLHNLKSVNLTLPRHKMVVFTGVSGSGKSTLAFDTIFAEGQRRYVESLGSYARQFIGQMEKPDVESIDGLSPAISIDQKSTSRSPRSTVGTVTEIYDFLRVLYARIGSPYCPQCQVPITPQTLQRILDTLTALPEGSKLQILSPVVRGRKGDYNALFQQLRKEGYTRVRVDGELLLLEELPETYRLTKTHKHNIEVVIDRIVLKNNDTCHHRLTESLQTSLKKSDGFCLVQILPSEEDEQERELFFSQHLACPECDLSFDEMAPRLFSFNSPYGACSQCEGLGLQYELSEALLVPDPNKTLMEGAIAPFEKTTGKYYQSFLKKLSKKHDLPIDTPFHQLKDEDRSLLFYGPSTTLNEDLPSSGKTSSKASLTKKSAKSQALDEDYDWFDFVSQFDGIIPILNRRHQYGTDATKRYIESFMQEVPCPTCQGKRLKPISLSVTLGNKDKGGLNIDAFCNLSIKSAYDNIQNVFASLDTFQSTVGRQAIYELSERLRFLLDVGLDYLTLSRRASSLSGGEAQRIRLATQIGSGLSGVLYVLDEPSIGLHQYNNQQLIQTLLRLRDQGNSLIVVEHDEDTIRHADWVVDIGPGAGIHGGNIVSQGTPDSVLADKNSLTGDYLSGRKTIAIPKKPRKPSGEALTIQGASLHNLKNVDVAFPLGQFICVTGLSGSGKSTLVFDLLYQALKYHFGKYQVRPEGYESITGLEHLDKFIDIDQSPIGRTPRSNPVTYTGIFDAIRNVFASTEEAKLRGYTPGHFSFNVKSGRCETCQGDGVITLEMNFLPDVHIPCEMCDGRRYSAQTLDVTYHGKNIADVLAMTVEEALGFFDMQPRITRQLKVLQDVGLDYITLGQSATTLSGGEAQRLKLATEFNKRSTGKTLYLLDEPTVGLHWKDLENLIGILNALVDQGNTVIVIEHNLDFIKVADHLIDMGPEGGYKGGYVVASGTPKEVSRCEDSYTGQFLKRFFKN
jgi:excinuclease ABC subunit A